MILRVLIDSIKAEKISNLKGNIQIGNKTSIKDVKEIKIGRGKVCEINFQFDTEYIKNKKLLAKIELKGRIVYKGKGKELVKHWKKEQKLPEELVMPIMNRILYLCSVRAITLSEQIELPPPLPLMRVKKMPDTTYIG